MSETLAPPAPPAAPAPVVVVPIPARQSRTLNLANIIAGLGGILAVLPELASDPTIIAFMNEMMSPGTRRVFGVVMVVVGFYLRNLRKTTNAPIIGTPAAAPPAPPVGAEKAGA